jgi:hypothetical protein
MAAVSVTPPAEYDGNGFFSVTWEKESLQAVMLITRHAETDGNGHF